MKYVDDEVRDEPINIGIILQSKKNYKIATKFFNDYHKLRYHVSNSALVKIILESVSDEIAKNDEKDILTSISSKFSGKLRFSDYRGTLAKNLESELDSLFTRYVSIGEMNEPKKIITVTQIKKRIWDLVHNRGTVQRNQIITGEKSKFRYDFVIGDRRKILHSISFDAYDSLKKTKLFDWNVMDVMHSNGLKEDRFGVIISEPSEINPKYHHVREQYNESMKILESKDYDLISYDETNEWKKQIQALV